MNLSGLICCSCHLMRLLGIHQNFIDYFGYKMDFKSARFRSVCRTALIVINSICCVSY